MTGEPDRRAGYGEVARQLAADALADRMDRQAVRVADALRAAGVRALLMRGPVLAAWLYDDRRERRYVDVDLLVAEEQVAAADETIRALGFAQPLAGAADNERPSHAIAFVGPGASIDLHWTIKGIGAPPSAVWEAMAAGALPLALAGGTVDTPGVPARLLIVALHAAQHGSAKAREDLERALARVPEAEWAAAARLADELDAGAAFAHGLRAVPGGPERLERLAFRARPDLAADARAEGRVHLLKGLVALRQTPGAVPKARLLVRELFPTRAFMGTWSERTGHGGESLAKAYLRRPFWLLRRLPGAYRAYRRARRSPGGR